MGAEFDRIDETRRRHINRYHEIAEHISALGRQDVRSGHLNHEVWLAELATALGTLAESAESLTAATALRRTLVADGLNPEVLAEAGRVLSRLEQESRARQALRLAE